MRVYCLDVLLFCFLLKKSTAIHVFIIDIPDDDFNDLNESEYVYYDYEQSLAPNIVKNKPLPINSIGLAHPKKKEIKQMCDRFGSMYGIDSNKHKCELLRLDDEKRRLKIRNPFLINPVNRQPRKIKNKPTSKFLDLTRDDFSLDYVDDYWRSRGENVAKCTLKDVVTNKCNYRKFFTNKQRTYDSELSSSESSDDTDDKPKRKKPKRFQVISHQDKELDESNKQNKKSNKKKQLSDETQSSEESESSDSEKIKKVVKEIQKKHKQIESLEADFIPAQPLTDLEEEEEMKPDDPKFSTLESDSFEENRPSGKFAYLQGHRFVNSKDFRRSRMEGFLPKQNTWKQEDIPKLGIFWFQGGPKGIF